MINVRIDESAAFDMLSIFEIKTKQGSDVSKQIISKLGFDFLKGDIINQIGPTKFDTIYSSEEYKNLLDANLEVFISVGDAKRDTVLASEVDSKNYKRYECKVAIQKKFFNGSMSEQKIGY